MKTVTVIGSGMAGLGAAHHLRENGIAAQVFDQNSYPGGHTASHSFPGGFTFDEGPHISFTANERLRELFAKSVNGEYEVKKARVNNYWEGHWIKHPAQCNLYSLDPELRTTLLKGFINAMYSEPGKIDNYEQWLHASYGEAFSELFPMRYTRKYHTTDAANLATDWLGPRLYRPSIDELLYGALSPDSNDVHYVTEFRYPKQGGFASFLKLFLDSTVVFAEHRVKRISVLNKTLSFENGKTLGYEHLISSIPLPELVKIVEDVPGSVMKAAAQLCCSEAVVVNLGFNRRDIIDAHWTYFYDEDILFSRISTPHLQAGGNVPAGCGSLQVEIYFSKKYKPRTMLPNDYIPLVIEDLIRVGLIEGDHEIIYRGAMYIPYANVIFDHDRKEALKKVHGYFDEIGIEVCGRYGDWDYIWTDQAFLSGEKAAKRVIAKA